MADFQRIGTDIGALVERKNAAYGNSFATCGAALKLLYPEGLRPEQMADALLLVRIWDKMMRIATARTAMGENPYQDIAGYGILGVAMHTTGSHTPGAEQEACGSVSEQDAGNQSTEQNASAAASAATPTMPSASGLNGSLSQLPSRMRSGQSSPSEAAPAPTAAAHARNVAVVLTRAQERNGYGCCASCGRGLGDDWVAFHFLSLELRCHQGGCVASLEHRLVTGVTR